jgi:predicted membrane channel-forming protein YqfA (hemolysin III family)
MKRFIIAIKYIFCFNYCRHFNVRGVYEIRRNSRRYQEHIPLSIILLSTSYVPFVFFNVIYCAERIMLVIVVAVGGNDITVAASTTCTLQQLHLLLLLLLLEMLLLLI